MATYVLVHGGGHGGWCWQRLAPLLRAEGHDVHTPTLTGLGERSHLVRPETDLDTHVTDVAAVLEYEDLTDVILVGHSYGGMVITGTADRVPDRIAQIVYLDAASPRDGQSLVDVAPALMDFARSDSRVVDGVDLVLWPSPDLAAALRRHRPRRPGVGATPPHSPPLAVLRAAASPRGRGAGERRSPEPTSCACPR